MQLDKTVAAVVTGGASGLGAATSRMLASHGWRTTSSRVHGIDVMEI